MYQLMWVAAQFFEKISLESRKRIMNAKIRRQKKPEKQTKTKKKTYFWYIFNNKTVTTALLASLTAFLWIR